MLFSLKCKNLRTYIHLPFFLIQDTNPKQCIYLKLAIKTDVDRITEYSPSLLMVLIETKQVQC